MSREPWIKQPAWLADVRDVEAENARGLRRVAKLRRQERNAKAKRPGMKRQADGETGAVWQGDCAEVFDVMTPAQVMIAAELGGGDDVRDEIFADAMAYFFTESAHPAHVLRRTIDLAFELDVGLLRDLSGSQVSAMRSRLPEAHAERVRTVLAGTRCAGRAVREHELLVDSTLRLAVAKRADSCESTHAIELPDLLQPVDGLRLRGLRGLLGFAFYAGGEPGVVVRRVFALAKWRPITSALIHDMTLHELGLIFGEVRATWSWRVKQVVNRFLALHRMNGGRAGYQRSDAACESYAEAARGNRNRIGALRAIA